MFENVDGRTNESDARVTGILIAHLGAFGSGELINTPRVITVDAPQIMSIYAP